MVTIISRAQWGAAYADGSGNRPLPATEAWLHHSVTVAPNVVPPFDDDDQAVRGIEQITQDRFGQGMAYTALVTPVGRLYEGHRIGRIGAHTGGHNTAGIGIALVGNYENTAPTAAQERAVAEYLVHAHRAGWLDQHRLDGGHRDTKATACPGAKAYARIGAINQLAVQIAAGTAPTPKEYDEMATKKEIEDVVHGVVDERLRYLLPRALALFSTGNGNAAFSPNPTTRKGVTHVGVGGITLTAQLDAQRQALVTAVVQATGADPADVERTVREVLDGLPVTINAFPEEQTA